MKKSPIPFVESSPSVLAEIRLIATDMDGTLTNQGQFTPALLQMLTKLVKADISTLIVTGRSAGWVQGIVSYLPVVGAIAENGGVFMSQTTLEPTWLVDIAAIEPHRQRLASTFAHIQTLYRTLQPSADNRFRLTDWTFDIGTLTPTDLATIDHLCQDAGWGFTYSTVQCHIRPAVQDKGVGLQRVLQEFLPDITAHQILTVGDSPNDEGLFDTALFPYSVGVANVQHYCDRLQHVPTFITEGAEVAGFQELGRAILAAQADCLP
ncbi:MAG: HAD family hydrolase [Cyanobacteria bacterium J06638_28]